MSLSIPGHLYADVMRLVNENNYSVEDAIAKAAAMAARSAKTGPGRAESAKRKETPATPAGRRTGANTAPRTLTVTIPTAPPKELMPNQQTKQSHWAPRSKARRALRNESAWQTALVMPHNWEPMTGPVHLDIYVHWPKRRRPDLDAAVSSVKAALDGMTDAGAIEDDRQIKRLTATHDYGAKAPGLTRLTITEIPE